MDCHILSGEMSHQKVIHCHYSIVIIVIIVSTVSISIITIKNFQKNDADEKSQKVRACCWPFIPPKGLRRDSLRGRQALLQRGLEHHGNCCAGHLSPDENLWMDLHPRGSGDPR